MNSFKWYIICTQDHNEEEDAKTNKMVLCKCT